MVPELEKPRVTEIQVRMDCNGCVQKIKKALHGVNGIYDLYIDFPQQKLTIIGWADPEMIVKAIKKTRKIATICSHTEPTQEPPPPTEPAPQEGNNTNPNEPPPPPQEPPNEAANSPPPDTAPPPHEPAAEPPKDQPPPPPDNPQPEPQPSPAPAASRPKDVGEVHVIYHHPPPDYGHRYSYGHHGYDGYWNKYYNGQGHLHEGPVPMSPVPVPVPLQVPPPPQPQPPQPQPQPQRQRQPQPQPQPQQPVYVTHGYNMYTPSPYVTEYEYVRSPPRPQAHYYPRMERMYHNYDQDQYQYYYNNASSSSNNGNITSFFSDENPNACSIV